MSLPPNVILVGSMGSGKTSAGKGLAVALGFDFVDTDGLIERDMGKKVHEIFESRGEAFFRGLEKKTVFSLRDRRQCVIATGGGIWMDEENRRQLSRLGWCVWLKVSPEQAWRRVSKGLFRRPLLGKSQDPFGTLKRKIAERDPVYALAHFLVVTDKKNSKDVIREIVGRIKETKPFTLPG